MVIDKKINIISNQVSAGWTQKVVLEINKIK